MAVDNRDFADHVELDGGNVYFEDKKLQEASAVTSGDVSTQHILLKDTDGNIQKIDKASFAAAVKDVLAGILANTDKGTTITNIAAIDNGSFGSVTPANLASVLGVSFNAFKVITLDESNGTTEQTIYPSLNNKTFYVIVGKINNTEWNHAWIGYKLSSIYGCFIGFDFGDNPIYLDVWKGSETVTRYLFTYRN